MPPELPTALRLLLLRDLRLAVRRWGQMATPLMFFAIVATLFPLALSPAMLQLREIAPGVLWVAALLSSLLALDALFRADLEDGSLEQLLLSPQPLPLLLLARTAAHWLMSAVPLIALAPLLAVALHLPAQALVTLMLALALGTPVLSLLGAIGAALTMGLHRGGALLALLVLPLAVPVLIFGARATDLAARGEDPAGPLFLLASLLFLALSLAPIAAAAALRVSLD
ncbi:MAG TPA: heme exporter protein CcmB [Gammaproteobacteria bacterium]|nr:heme exporter protein CcmB [Gammaproteobacteria bacterium]